MHLINFRKNKGALHWLPLTSCLMLWGFGTPCWTDEYRTPQRGQMFYAKICGHCHETGVGPQIRHRNLPPEYVKFIVRNGRGAMPTFRSAEFDDDLLAEIIDYLESKGD